MSKAAKQPKAKKSVSKKTPVSKTKSKSTGGKTKLKRPIVLKSESKSDFLEQLSSIKQVKQKTKLPAQPALSLRNNLSLALLSPYRLPIDAEKIAMQSARIAGMAFVIIGAFLTLFNLPLVNGELASGLGQIDGRSQLAEAPWGGGNANRDNSRSYCDQYPISCGQTGYTFSAAIRINENSDSQISTIKITTVGAEKIELRQVNSSGQTQKIGYAAKTDPKADVWYYDWDVSQVPEGSYKVYGLVENNNGIYNTDMIRTEVKHLDLLPDVLDIETEPEPEPEPTEANTATTSPNVTPPPATPSPPPATESVDYKLSVNNAKDLKGLTEVNIAVEDASSVEVFVLPKNGTTPRYLGMASVKAKNDWRYFWNTVNTPNGDYRLYATAKQAGVKNNSPYVSVTVNNRVVNLESKEVMAAPITEVVTTPIKIDETKLAEKPILPPPIYKEAEEKIAAIEAELETEKFVASSEEFSPLRPGPEDEALIETELDKLMSEYQVDINNEIESLKLALRSGDENQSEVIKHRLAELQQKMIKNSYATGDGSMLSFVGQRLNEEVSGLIEKVAYTERIIKERVGEEVFKDTDNDGITDYDENVIYQTDPSSADSDGDGFNDGAEILKRFDPKDASPEAAVVFESPRNAGLERKDILTIASIDTIKLDKTTDAGEELEVKAALIKGKGLPNSFVTLYIFSTPVIVTVKTDAEGNWEYTFDKELEDGEHEVFVGVTDNTGAVVAKSEPLRFVKTAEAFTPIAQAENAPEVVFAKSEPGFLSQTMIMLVLSISVIIIGLILMILGLHLKSRRGEHLVQEGYNASA